MSISHMSLSNKVGNPLEKISNDLFDQLSIGIIVLDQQGTITYINPAFYNICEVQSSENCLRTLDDIFRLLNQKLALPQFAQTFQEQCESSEQDTIELNEVFHSGRRVRIQFSPQPAKETRLLQFHDLGIEKPSTSISEFSTELISTWGETPFFLGLIDENGKLIQFFEQGFNEKVFLNTPPVVGLDFFKAIKSLDPEISRKLQAKLQSGEIVNEIISLQNTTVQLLAHPQQVKDGKVLEANVLIYDMSDLLTFERTVMNREQQYRTILENIEEGYYEVDLLGRLTFINQSTARLLGFQGRELLPGGIINYQEFMSEAQFEKLKWIFARVLKTRQPVHGMEIEMIGVGNQPRNFEISVSVRENTLGSVEGLHGFIRDTTERRKAQDALAIRMVLLGLMQQVSMELNQTLDIEIVLSMALNAAVLLSYADYGVICLVEGNNVRIVRSNIEELVGQSYSKENGILGRVLRNSMAELVWDVHEHAEYTELIPNMQAEIAVPLISRGTIFGALVLETSNAKRFSEEIFEFVQLLTVGIAASIDNARLYSISQSQLNEMRQLNEQLSQAEQLKTEMIRVTAHDIRSPLGIITGYLDIVERDLDAYLNDDHKLYLESIRRAANRINTMSRDILSLERAQSRQYQTYELHLLSDIVQHSLIDLRDAARQKDQTLSVEIDKEHTHVCIDPTSIREAIHNLIGNAIKYTLVGGLVSVKVYADAEKVYFEVKDNGVGIPARLQERLFQPFYRAKTQETAHIEGTGLGLYLVKQIIDSHGGKMFFESEHGHGSTFGFQLPLAQMKDKDANAS